MCQSAIRDGIGVRGDYLGAKRDLTTRQSKRQSISECVSTGMVCRHHLSGTIASCLTRCLFQCDPSASSVDYLTTLWELQIRNFSLGFVVLRLYESKSKLNEKKVKKKPINPKFHIPSHVCLFHSYLC